MESASEPGALILIGHGAPARDTPKGLVRRLKMLESERVSRGGHAAPMTEEERELDSSVRRWPRTRENDPYREGVEALAYFLREIAHPMRVRVAFNELCAPTLEEVVDELVAEGVSRIVIVTTMMTPGGVHADEEIPAEVERLRRRLDGVELRYAWPFDLRAVARLLFDQAASQALPITATT